LRVSKDDLRHLGRDGALSAQSYCGTYAGRGVFLYSSIQILYNSL
jgi:hypothetical protein